jgi:putative heme-binding domain-containing protein
VALRRAAVLGVAGFEDSEARRVLADWARTASVGAVRATAIAALARVDREAASAAAAALLTQPLEEASVRELVEAFLTQREGTERLERALAKSLPAAANVPPMMALLAESGRRDPRLAALLTQAAGTATALGTVTKPDLEALLADARQSGDRSNGKRVFERPALGCVVCHSVDGTPGKVGPDLSALGTAQTMDFILAAILEPQRDVKEGFMAHEIETTKGEIYQGYLRGGGADPTLYDHLSRGSLRFARQQILKERQLGSLMPSGLADGLTREELRDLLAYLAGLGSKEPSP